MKYFYHPESDCVIKVPDHEVEQLFSGDGALCVEITRAVYIVSSGDTKPDEPYEKENPCPSTSP